MAASGFGILERRCLAAVRFLSHEFLLELLGLNMEYESLPLHLVIVIQELRESS